MRKDSQWGLQSMRIRTDDLEVTELQEGPVGKGRARHIGKDSDAGRDWGQEEKGTTEDEMAGWHH